MPKLRAQQVLSAGLPAGLDELYVKELVYTATENEDYADKVAARYMLSALRGS